MARVCPHCDVETPDVRNGFWRHVRKCEKNPEPVCPKCKAHVPAEKFERHTSRCGTRKQTPEAVNVEVSSGDNGSHVADASDVVQAVPEERLTPTDKLVLPLMADPSEKPAPPGAPGKRSRRASPRRQRETVDETAAAASSSSEPQSGLPAAFASREPPRTTFLESVGDSLKQNWILLALIGIGVALAIAWHRLNADEVTLRAPVQQSTPPPSPGPRPPYNPVLHGSPENYRQTFATIEEDA